MDFTSANGQDERHTVWSQIKSKLIPSEEEEIRAALGNDLIERNQTVLDEVNAYLQILTDMDQNNPNANINQSEYMKKQKTESEILFFIEQIRKKADSCGVNEKEFLRMDTAREKVIMQYVTDASSRPSTSASMRRTQTMRPSSCHGERSMFATGSNFFTTKGTDQCEHAATTHTVGEIQDKLNIAEIHSVKNRIKEAMDEEYEDLIKEAEDLKRMVFEESASTNPLKAEPTLAELQSLNKKLEAEYLKPENPALKILHQHDLKKKRLGEIEQTSSSRSLSKLSSIPSGSNEKSPVAKDRAPEKENAASKVEDSFMSYFEDDDLEFERRLFASSEDKENCTQTTTTTATVSTQKKKQSSSSPTSSSSSNSPPSHKLTTIEKSPKSSLASSTEEEIKRLSDLRKFQKPSEPRRSSTSLKDHQHIKRTQSGERHTSSLQTTKAPLVGLSGSTQFPGRQRSGSTSRPGQQQQVMVMTSSEPQGVKGFLPRPRTSGRRLSSQNRYGNATNLASGVVGSSGGGVDGATRAIGFSGFGGSSLADDIIKNSRKGFSATSGSSSGGFSGNTATTISGIGSSSSSTVKKPIRPVRYSRGTTGENYFE